MDVKYLRGGIDNMRTNLGQPGDNSDVMVLRVVNPDGQGAKQMGAQTHTGREARHGD
jgi:hypothetical protein